MMNFKTFGLAWFEVKLQDWPLLSHLLLILLWLGLWRASTLMEFEGFSSLWFPPAGLSLAALTVIGKRALLPLLIAAIISTFLAYHDSQSISELLTGGILFGLLHCFSYGLGAWVLRNAKRDSGHQNLPSAMLTLMVVSPVCALLAATLGASHLYLMGMMDFQTMLETIEPWWMGDFIGVLVLMPFAIGVIKKLYPGSGEWIDRLGLGDHQHQGYVRFIAKLLACLVALFILMFATAKFDHQVFAYCVFFLFVPQMWIVYTERASSSAFSLAVMGTATAILVKVLDLGNLSLVYQFATSVLAASTYFGLMVPMLVAHNSRLSRLSQLDSLTQAATRNYFWEQAGQEIDRAEHYRQPISLVVFDLDHFKQVNDVRGHSAGDKALTTIAKVILADLRKADLLGRFGGDEFMLLLPGSNLLQASETAERVRQLIETCDIRANEQKLTGSLGVTEIRASETIQQAFERADQNLLAAKRNGKNQICCC